MLVKVIFLFLSFTVFAAPPRHLQGEKSGEVTATTAILLTRTTQVKKKYGGQDVLGKSAVVRFRYADNKAFKKSKTTDWKTTTRETDYHYKVKLEGLSPWTKYYYRLEIKAGKGKKNYPGPIRSFRTAPAPDQKKDITFVAVTGLKYRGQDTKRGFSGFDVMAKQGARFIFMSGDNVYYDADFPRAIDRATCRLHWHRMYKLPALVDFFARVPGYWSKDDHDYRWDDADPYQTYITARNADWFHQATLWPLPEPTNRPTHEEGRAIFIEQNPVDPATPYRSVQWGAGLEVFVVEGRDFRSPNSVKDGPNKSLWGVTQREWLKQSLVASKAMFKVLLSSSPLIGPDKAPENRKPGELMKRDNHVNEGGFRHEGQAFLKWAQENLKNFFIVCGDRHWQYHSIDKGISEFCSGAIAEKQFGGKFVPDQGIDVRFKDAPPGFLKVSILVEKGKPRAKAGFYSKQGKLRYSHTLQYKE
jgi:phosphodiesterase/alkaline phosphatase D-like protein